MNLLEKKTHLPSETDVRRDFHEDLTFFQQLVERSESENSHIIEQLNGYFGMRQLYNAAIKEINTKLDILNEEFRVRYDRNPIHHIESRLKSPESIFQKAKRYGVDLTLQSIEENITDVAGVRVICCYVDDIYLIKDVLLRQSDIALVTCKDYITTPKKNGYRSLHLVVKTPVFLSDRVEHVPVEIQIRTIGMDLWASLEHQLRYKRAQDIPEGIEDELKHCADEIARIDQKMQGIYQKL